MACREGLAIDAGLSLRRSHQGRHLGVDASEISSESNCNRRPRESCNTRSLLGQRLQGGRVAGMLVYIYIFFYISGMLHAVGGQEDKTADQVAHVDYAVYLVRPYAA